MREKVVVITGASAGIGAALAERLGREGARLVLVARRQSELDAVAARAGDAIGIAADMTRRDEAARVVREAIARFGQVDVWVNNVGRGISRAPSELTDADIDEMMLVNVKSALYGMQEVLPHFKSRNSGQIINISSLLGRVPVFEAILKGTERRIRPVTMTALTAILGLLPAAFSDKIGSESQRPLAIVVVGGMIGTLLFFNLVPVLYSFYGHREPNERAGDMAH